MQWGLVLEVGWVRLRMGWVRLRLRVRDGGDTVGEARARALGERFRIVIVGRMR